jgi:hypothetical protein
MEFGQTLATLRTGPRVTSHVGAVICGGNGRGTVLIPNKLKGDETVPDLTPTWKQRPVTQMHALVRILHYSI